MVDKNPVSARQGSSPRSLSIEKVRSAFPGAVIAPGAAEYDQARAAFYGGIDNHPAIIIRPRNAEEVCGVVSLARDTGLDLSIRSGGHSVVGYGIADGGIMLDLSSMRGLQIDAEERTAWADAGLTAGEYTTAAAAHGLATGFGDTGSVGIGGITLGGGIGYLVRKYGLTIDDLLAAEVVTADGQILQVDAENHPDLFWAIRGGGGNFGVVTRFKYRLHPLGQVYGGFLFLPATPETVAGSVAAAEAASDELSAILNVMPLPPMPFIPEEHHGKMAVFLLGIYSGDPADGPEAFAPFRALAEPFAALLRPLAYPEIYPPAPEEEYHPMVAQRNMFLDRVDLPVAETIMEQLGAIDSPMKAVQLRVLGGAMARVPADATAFAHRSSRIMAQLVAMHSGGTDGEAKQAWVDAFVSAVRQGDRGAYVNFIADEGLDGVHAAYPGATWDRLLEGKRRYDPTNLFHLNQNVPPTSS